MLRLSGMLRATPMPDLPVVRAALAEVTQICGNAVQWLDLPSVGKAMRGYELAELRADMQAARAQLDKAEQSLGESHD